MRRAELQGYIRPTPLRKSWLSHFNPMIISWCGKIVFLPRIIFMVLTLPLILQTPMAAALSEQDFRCLYAPCEQYVPNINCDSTPTPPGTQPTVAGGKIYILGDSLTKGMKAELEASLKPKYSEVRINGQDSRPLYYPSGRSGPVIDGFTALNDDKAFVAQANTIVIGLGTNTSGDATNFTKQVTDMIAAINTINTNKPNIFWTNIVGVKASKPLYASYNKVLQDLSGSLRFTVINWFATVDPNTDPTNPSGPNDSNGYFSNDSLGVHPTANGGFTKLIELINKALGGVAASPASQVTLPEECICDAGGESTTPLNGDDNIAKIYNYLLGKVVAGVNLKDYHVAGILGNMQHESGYQEQRLQGTPSGVKTPAESLSASQLAAPRLGWGLVQWTPVSKVINPLKAAGKNPNDLATQLDFLLEQLNGGTPSGEGAAGRHLVSTTNVAGATVSFELKYERHAGGAQPARIIEAQKILERARQGQLGGGTSPTPAAPAPGGIKPVIVLDPGHGGTGTNKIDRTDPATGLHDGDFNNDAERKSVFAVAQMVKAELEQAGYQVILTKDSAEALVYLRDRANIGNNAKAAIGVSIHTQGDRPFGTWQEIYVQKVGLYRGDGANKQVFNDAAVAAASQKYAAIMKQERDAIEVKSGTTVIKDNSFDARGGGIEPGNIPLVQLWATVPWIYLEAGGNNATTGLTEPQKATYAKAISSGIKKAVPPGAAAPSSTDGCGSSASTGDLPSTVLAYAWPDYRGSGYVTMKPEYAQATTAARAAGQYIGGIRYPGVDCGGFTTRLIINSGFDPTFNHSGKGGPTPTQLAWSRANWQKVGRGNTLSTADLRPGDIAFRVTSSGGNDGHTFAYAGDIPNFGSKIASASLDGRAPMAGKENPLGGNIEWYRKK